MLGIPYIAGLSEQLGRVYKSHGVHMFHKPANTLRSKLVHPKDKTPMEGQCGTIYHITCSTDPNHTYVGESKRTVSQRFKEHTKLDAEIPTAVAEHTIATGHTVSIQNVKVLAREQQWLPRKVKEAIYIRQLHPTINTNRGYTLPAIYSQIIPPAAGSNAKLLPTSVRDQGQ